MDSGLSYFKLSSSIPLPSTARSPCPSIYVSGVFSPDWPRNLSRDSRFFPLPLRLPVDRSASVVAASGSGTDSDRLGFCGLNAPLDPRSPRGRFLGGVLQDDRGCFLAAVDQQLESLVGERRAADARSGLSSGSDEACLHRRITGLKNQERQTAAEEIIYMLIYYRFLDIRVHLVPRLSECICNGRLEVWPSRDWELESIHSSEVLEMIKEHLTSVIGWKANSSVVENWATTKIRRPRLRQVYAASIYYGYSLKSASLRHRLELSLDKINNIIRHGRFPLLELWTSSVKKVISGYMSSRRTTLASQVSYGQGKEREKLKCYLMDLDPQTLQMYAKPKSKEAANLIERHISALFGEETDDVICTSLATQKRFILEAIAFGSFLWESEEYVNSLYKLSDNRQ